MNARTTTPSRALRALVLVVAAAMLALPAAAFAAPAPVAQYDVRTILQQDGSRAMLAAVELAPDAKLPAEVSVNVPKGAKVDWAGEILGGDLAQDPTVQYTTKSGAEFDTLTFTLTKAKRGQVELLYPAGSTKAGDVTKATLDYAPAQAAPRVGLSIEVPADAKVGSVPADLKKQPTQGSSFYTKDFQNVAAGQKLQVAVEYTGGSVPQPQAAPAQGQPGAAAPQTGGSSSMSPLIAVLALGAILAATFAVLTYMGKGKASAEAVAEGDAPVRATRRDDDEDGFFEDDDEPVAAPVKAAPAKKPAAKTTAAKSTGAGKATAARKTAPKSGATKSTAGKTTSRRKPAKKDDGSVAAGEA